MPTLSARWCPLYLPAQKSMFLRGENPPGVGWGSRWCPARSAVPGDHRGFDAEISDPEGGLALAGGIQSGGTGFVGWVEWILPPQTGLWAFPPCLLQPRAAKFSSALSLFFPRPFPCNFLTLSLCKPQNSEGFQARLQSFGFTPAALAQLVPVPCPSRRSGAGAVTGGHWDLVAAGTWKVSLQAWEGSGFLLQIAQK